MDKSRLRGLWKVDREGLHCGASPQREEDGAQAGPRGQITWSGDARFRNRRGCRVRHCRCADEFHSAAAVFFLMNWLFVSLRPAMQ